MNVEITGLTRRFGRTMAVAGLDLQAGPGVLGLLGPNGAGKTSLLRVMATAIRPTSGTLRLLGRDPGSYGPRREIRRRLGDLGQRATIVVSTHLVEDVGAACTQVALMDRGMIVFHGTPADLTARGEGYSVGDAPLECGYSAVLAGARS